VRFALLIAVASSCAGCALAGVEPGDACEAQPIDSFAELLVVDESVLAPSAPVNVPPWSPARLLETAGSGQWLARGLERWRDAARGEGHEAVANAIDAEVLCRWLRRTASNACDVACVACDGRDFEAASAPFRTLAVVNRTDLRLLPDARSPAGEARIVLGLAPTADGAPPVAFTLIFEFAQAGSPTTWATRWHALSALDGPGRSQSLAEIVERFALAAPLPDGRPVLSQVRGSIDAAPEASELRELAADENGELVPRGLRNTPRIDLDGTPALDAFARAEAARIRRGTHVVPADMLAPSQRYGSHDWSLPGVDGETRLELDRGTCAGCHAHDPADGGFQISPLTTGRAAVSRFLLDPRADDDELRRREREQHALLCPEGQGAGP